MFGDVYRHSTLAHVDGRNFERVAGVHVFDVPRNPNRNAEVAPAFALHEGASCAKTRLGALARSRLVENKMGANVKYPAQAHGMVQDGDGNGTLVAEGVSSAAKHIGRAFVAAIDDDSLKALAGQLAQSPLGVRAQFHFDFQI